MSIIQCVFDEAKSTLKTFFLEEVSAFAFVARKNYCEIEINLIC